MDDYLICILMKWCWCGSSSCMKKMGQENDVTTGFVKTSTK